MEKVPKVWFAHSLTLIYYLLDRSFGLSDYQILQKETKPLITLWEKHGQTILNTIPYFTGIPWQREEITIYIVPDRGQKSFSHPLVLV